jgi:hypothetical protein
MRENEERERMLTSTNVLAYPRGDERCRESVEPEF